MRRSPRLPEAPLLAGLALTVATIAWSVLDLPYTEFVLVLLAGVMFALGSAPDLRRSGPVALLTLIALEVTAGVADDAYVPIALVAAGAFWIGTQSGARRRLIVALERRNHEIEAEQREFERLAVRRERARIAAELHDIVSHHLSMVVVQAGAGRIAPDADEEASRARFAAIRQGGVEALGELASLVDVLEPEPIAPTPETFRALIDRARESGIAVAGEPEAVDSLDAEVAAVAYRVIQEGLTNAIKHGDGAGRLTIHSSPTELAIELRNERASASELAASGSGSGLDAMRRRVAEVGGELDAGPAEESAWLLSVRLPISAPREVAPGSDYLARMS